MVWKANLLGELGFKKIGLKILLIYRCLSIYLVNAYWLNVTCNL